MRNKTMKRQRGGLLNLLKIMNREAEKGKGYFLRKGKKFYTRSLPKGFKKGFQPKRYRQEEDQPYEPNSNLVQEDPTPQYSNQQVTSDECPPIPPDGNVTAYFQGMRLIRDEQQGANCIADLESKNKEFFNKCIEYLKNPVIIEEDEPPKPQGGRRTKKQTRRKSKR